MSSTQTCECMSPVAAIASNTKSKLGPNKLLQHQLVQNSWQEKRRCKQRLTSTRRQNILIIPTSSSSGGQNKSYYLVLAFGHRHHQATSVLTKKLLSEHCNWALSWKDDKIPKNAIRIFGKRKPAQRAEAEYIATVSQLC